MAIERDPPIRASLRTAACAPATTAPVASVTVPRIIPLSWAAPTPGATRSESRIAARPRRPPMAFHRAARGKLTLPGAGKSQTSSVTLYRLSVS